MNILVINTGSSSLKYQLLDMDKQAPLAGGIVERIGEAEGILTHKVFTEDPVRKEKITQAIPTHKEAMLLVADQLTDSIDAVGHRVVQGGEAFKEAIQITDEVKNAIQEYNPLAPLHNPANIIGIDVAEELFPGKPQVAVFDTNFHQTLPEKAFRYALPEKYYTEHKVRKYGFHGTSHKYVTARTAELMGKPVEELKLITLHLGNGCSMCAVDGGKCMDTSMGMTPLAGVMMGTRAGDVDPAIFGYLLKETGMPPQEIDDVLNKQSGFKGMCGYSDLRDVHAQAEQGNKNAALAIEMFVYQVIKYVGAYTAVLGGVDALAFTAGVGEKDEIIRAKVIKGLAYLGIELDEDANNLRIDDPRALHTEGSRLQAWVVPTNEELQIAIETMDILK